MPVNIDNIIFINPEWLLLLPILLIVTLVLQLRAKHNNYFGEPSKLAMISHSGANRLLHPLINLSPKTHTTTRHSFGQFFVYSLVITCLVMALAEPVRIGEKLPEPPQERDIVFIIDTSVSMILRDYVLEGQRVDRMSLLKELLHRFIKKLEGERMSLVVLGDEVHTLVPLTRDQSLLVRMLSRIEAGMAGRFNAIGEGIALAVSSAMKRPNDQNNRHCVLILLTDASQPTGQISPMTAAQLAKEANIPLYTITIGATSYAAEELRNAGLIYHPANPALLQSIAELTGAQNYQASNSQTLEQAIQDIEQRETNARHIPPRHYYTTLYFWPLISGVLLFVSIQFFQLFRHQK